MCIEDKHKYQAVIDVYRDISTGQFTGATVFILVMIAIFGGWTTCKNRIETILACIAGFVSIAFFFCATVIWCRRTQVAEKCGRALEKKSLKDNNGNKIQQEKCCLFITRGAQSFWSKVNPRLLISAAIIWIAFTIATVLFHRPPVSNKSTFLNSTSLTISDGEKSWSVTATRP